MFKKVCVIIGFTSGLGKSLTDNLLKNNLYKLILIGRNKKKVNNLKNKINSSLHEFYVCDLTKIKEIKKLINKLIKVKKIDILINNAGALFLEKKKILYSRTIMLNYFSYVYITEKLKFNIERSLDKKIIFISSHVQSKASFDNNDFHVLKKYNFWELYKISKLFITTYAFILKKKNKILNIYSFDPGRLKSRFKITNNIFISKLLRLYLNILGNKTDLISDKIINIITNKKGNFYSINKKKTLNKICLKNNFQKKLWEFTNKRISKY